MQVLHGKALGKRAWHGDHHRRYNAAAGRDHSEEEGMAPKEVGDGEKEAALGKLHVIKAVFLPFHLPSRLGGKLPCAVFFTRLDILNFSENKKN